MIDRGKSFYIKGGEEGKDGKRLWCSKIIQKMAILVVGRHHILHISQTFYEKKKWKVSTLEKPIKLRRFKTDSEVCWTNKSIFSIQVSSCHQFSPRNCEATWRQLHKWALKVRWSSGLHLFLAGQAHCICIQVLRSSPVIHLCGGLAHHELPYLALTEAKGKWLFPAFWIIVKQCY